MAGAWHQICKTDFVDLTEIWVRYPIPSRNDSLDIQTPPADVGQRDFAQQPIDGRTIRMVSDEPSSVSQFHNRPNLVEAGHLRIPADSGEARQIRVIGLLTQSQSTRRGTHPCPNVNGVVFIRCSTVYKNLFPRGSVKLEFKIRIRDGFLRDRMLVVGRILLPLFPEEEWCASACGSSLSSLSWSLSPLSLRWGLGSLGEGAPGE